VRRARPAGTTNLDDCVCQFEAAVRVRIGHDLNARHAAG
jgi:hypothetical protein